MLSKPLGMRRFSMEDCAMPKVPEELDFKMPGLTLSARGREAVRWIAVPIAVLLLVLAWRLLVG
jgi:hypothetical protein